VKLAFVDHFVYAYLAGRPGVLSGAERQLWLLGRALASQGWSVVFGVDHGLRPGERHSFQGVEFVGIGGAATLVNWHRFLASERPDWSYWRGAYHLLGPSIELAKRAGARTIYAAAFDRDVHPRQALSLRPRLWPLYAWALARTDRIFVQHGGQLANLRQPWRAKASIVYSIAGTATARRSHRERSPYVAWVGMLRQHKRPDLLIEVARKAPDVPFVVCGGPSPHRSAPGYGERIIEAFRRLPNVQYLGHTSPERAQQVMSDAALLLSTSDEEGFPNTFLQAWSSGTPVVSLTVDPDGVIARLELGAVAGTVENAASTIHALLASPDGREAIAARAVRHVGDVHSEASVTASFHAAIGECRA